MAEQKNSNNWSIHGLRGKKDWLKEQISKRVDMDECDRVYLCARLDLFDAKYNVFTIDCHVQDHDGKTAADPSQKPSIQNRVTPALFVNHLSITPESVGGV